MVEVLQREETNSTKYSNALMVIRRVLDKDDAELVNFLRVQSAQANSEKGRRKLLSAAELLQKKLGTDQPN
jgi:hypothetical protein